VGLENECHAFIENFEKGWSSSITIRCNIEERNVLETFFKKFLYANTINFEEKTIDLDSINIKKIELDLSYRMFINEKEIIPKDLNPSTIIGITTQMNKSGKLIMTTYRRIYKKIYRLSDDFDLICLNSKEKVYPVYALDIPSFNRTVCTEKPYLKYDRVTYEDETKIIFISQFKVVFTQIKKIQDLKKVKDSIIQGVGGRRSYGCGLVRIINKEVKKKIKTTLNY